MTGPAPSFKRPPERPPHVDRATWRAALAAEAKALKTGAWGPWERFDGAPIIGNGWVRRITHVFRNRCYVVMVRPFDAPGLGAMQHFAIRAVSSLEPPWRNLQRIKDELAGPELFAVQVCPPAADMVDGADLYHLWIYPAGYRPTFGLHREGINP